MSLLQKLGIDPAKVNADDTEREMNSGGLCPEGLHHAGLVGCREDSAHNGSEFRELTFRVLAGPGKGMEVKESIFLPNESQTDEKKKKTQNRVIIYMHRLGLLKKVGDHYEPIDGLTDFQDVVNRAECVIEVHHEDREYTGKDGKTRKGKFAKLTFEGVLALDDKRCKAVARGKFVPGDGVTPTIPNQPRKTQEEERKAKYANI